MDEIHYPIPEGYVENKLLLRGLDGEGEVDMHILKCNEFKGAVADCLWSLLQSPQSFSEANKSISRPDIDAIVKLANEYYREIGEPERIYKEAEVKFGW